MSKVERYNKIASAPKNKSKDVVNSLGLEKGSKILEIGIGGGFYASLFSEIIGESGMYYGIDTDEGLINNLISIPNANITGIKIKPNEIPKVPEKVELIFARNAYHHIKDRMNYFRKLSDKMTDNGKVAIIDYDESLSWLRLFGHYTKKSVLVKELEEVGFTVVEDLNFLHKQSFLVFEKSGIKKSAV